MSRIVLRSKEMIRKMIDIICLENYNILNGKIPLKDDVKEDSIRENNVWIEKLQDALHFDRLPEDKEDDIYLWLVMSEDSILDMYGC